MSEGFKTAAVFIVIIFCILFAGDRCAKGQNKLIDEMVENQAEVTASIFLKVREREKQFKELAVKAEGMEGRILELLSQPPSVKWKTKTSVIEKYELIEKPLVIFPEWESGFKQTISNYIETNVAGRIEHAAIVEGLYDVIGTKDEAIAKLSKVAKRKWGVFFGPGISLVDTADGIRIKPSFTVSVGWRIF